MRRLELEDRRLGRRTPDHQYFQLQDWQFRFPKYSPDLLRFQLQD
jgi:hypothetical protein